MKASEIREMSSEELSAKMEELNQEAFKLRFQNATAQLENTAMISRVKKDIARIKTIVSARKAQEEEA
ncbi:MAG: 50S ribosomal protein L29 [Magnetococcales bacterium]|nr:50S ribosomal protein L29 [Magnetococcales bacterium]